ncbi:galactosyltransferase-related protein [Luteipulveratus sp. YIM 133132]|uniref:Galactosyltransferase-related protein n=1 Tax=Luteipulveratus flavus TaxID=3031728 RepID=A0ABT6C5S2_9MICO|nr:MULTISPECIES: galactosyltransferase-related protein [unclassified Luteipulveratus]MDE9366457.1 galactosyltransferase-related protein [Luteipulveratus sp. YIM 133132]MDF8264269.1 galactosyltransferase-related protein [Luteipulveratus sp. YIM 133296]
MSRAALVTIAHGRHDHLTQLMRGSRRSTRPPDVLVVVAMGDPQVRDVVRREAGALRTHVVDLPADLPDLPLAAARNAGVAAARELGATILVLLDVDCIPGPSLLQRYTDVVAQAGGPVVLAGEVDYLPPRGDGEYDHARLAQLGRPHPSRPALRSDELRTEPDLRMFWSLSFALSAQTWDSVGGFDERYEGYGGEDTDFGQRLGRASVPLVRLGGARAYHQHHPVSKPPVEHAAAIVRNANLFHQIWGWFPMTGWLDDLAGLGLVRQVGDGHAARWECVDG